MKERNRDMDKKKEDTKSLNLKNCVKDYTNYF